MSNQFMMAVKEEDGTIGEMAKKLGITKAEVAILSLNLLNYVLEQRAVGNHLGFVKNEDKTKDILKEATAGEVNFKLNN